jgi:hypothetical protein
MDKSLPNRLSSPNIFLVRMVIFLVIAAFVGVLLWRQVFAAFMANPALNGLIFGVLLIGVILALIQVAKLFREVKWVNGFRSGGPTLAVERGPVMLAPMAALLGDKIGRVAIGPSALRGILESIGTRLDEDRDISRYLTGLLVFLGLLGTFWGLTETVTAIGRTISGLDVRAGDAGTVFDNLKSGLAAPLSGMGTAFSSSLFGLAGSLILGFLDLQAGQAQNRFYQELEEWLSEMTEVSNEGPTPQKPAAGVAGAPGMAEVQLAIDRLTRAVNEGGSNRQTTAAMANLAEGIQGLVQHMRQEQQLIRDWVEAQATQQKEMRRVLDLLAQRLDEKRS